MINKNGKKKNLFPVVIIDDNKKLIVFKEKGWGEPNDTCSFVCLGNRCTCMGRCGTGKGCSIMKWGDTVIGCVCQRPARL